MEVEQDAFIVSQFSTQVLPETQEVCSQQFDQSLIEENVWGRLLPLRRNVPVYNLVENYCSFGRGEVTHRFLDAFDKNLLLVLSKFHFEIRREVSGNEVKITIVDKSQNGTFVNKKPIGKSKKKILRNNDEISLAKHYYKVFVFYDCLHNDLNEYPSVLTDKYTMSKKLGDGTYGEVRLAYTQDTLDRVAVKIIKKRILSANGTTVRFNNMSQINNEVELLRSVDHPCIVKLLDIIEGPERIYLVMELAEGGELFDRISNNGRLKEPIAKIFFYQLLNAVAYLHGRKITHRDIKPENILLETDDIYTRIKLTDFGLSKLTQDASIMTSLCGTPTYIAPELLAVQEGGVYNSKVDLWSLGVVLFVCLAGYTPFNGKTDVETRHNICRAKYRMTAVWKDVSEEAKDLISKLLVINPVARYSAEQVFDHPWLDDPELVGKSKRLMNFPIPNAKRRLSDAGVEEEPNKTPRLMNGVASNMLFR